MKKKTHVVLLLQCSSTAGGDITRLDNNGHRAMSDLDVEYWYLSHKHQLCRLLGNPTVVGHDDRIFSDKRTQFAIDHQWQKNDYNTFGIFWFGLFTLHCFFIAV